ncbi:MAG: hypothetical protein H0V00_05435 [Chloroflexia bacterium]|nr:hypothetical protein [Chloroflexia bacterium]
MSIPRSVTHLAATSFALILSIAATAPALAQEGTPEPGGMVFPVTPDPALCQVEARTTDELLALWYTPEGSPVPAATPAPDATSVRVPLGPRADEATTAAVTAVVTEVFACFAGGEFVRATALFTDDLTRSFGGEPGTTMEDARTFLEASPVPEVMAEPDQIIAVTDVMELSDGRLGAIVVDRSAGQQDAVYVIFENRGDRWLVAEIIDFAPVDDM